MKINAIPNGENQGIKNIGNNIPQKSKTFKLGT